jgi:hypothetical protein
MGYSYDNTIDTETKYSKKRTEINNYYDAEDKKISDKINNYKKYNQDGKYDKDIAGLERDRNTLNNNRTREKNGLDNDYGYNTTKKGIEQEEKDEKDAVGYDTFDPTKKKEVDEKYAVKYDNLDKTWDKYDGDDKSKYEASNKKAQTDYTDKADPSTAAYKTGASTSSDESKQNNSSSSPNGGPRKSTSNDDENDSKSASSKSPAANSKSTNGGDIIETESSKSPRGNNGSTSNEEKPSSKSNSSDSSKYYGDDFSQNNDNNNSENDPGKKSEESSSSQSDDSEKSCGGTENE